MNNLNNWGRALFACALVFGLVACGGGDDTAAPAAPAAAPAASAGASGSGTISGIVSVVDATDPDNTIKMDADPVCAGLHDHAIESETLVTDDSGNLANAFVYVKSGLTGSYSAPGDVATITQEGCVYIPHVSGVQVGQTLKVVNGDPTLHNVHATPKKNPEFNQAQPFQDMELERKFDTAEVMIPFKCDVHPWMSSYLAVLDHPFFAVTGADGTFSIDGLPAGDYELEIWHETLGTQSASASVADGGSAEVAVSFGG